MTQLITRDHVGAVLTKGLDKAIAVPSVEVDRTLRSLRLRFPNASDDEMVRRLEHWYIGLASAGGAAAGGVAAVPGVGIPMGAAAAATDVGAFLVLTGTYVLAVASVRGIEVSDLDRRKALLIVALIGPGAAGGAVEKAGGRIGQYWGRQLTKKTPIEVIKRINKGIAPNFITKYGAKQGVIVLGQLVPFGIGAGIGAAGNGALAWGVVRTLRGAFGPEPSHAETPGEALSVAAPA